MGSLWAPTIPWLHFILRGTVVYLSVLLLLRLGGKRQVGQMGRGEFVAILLISNAVQNAMNGGDNSISGGIVLAATLIILSRLVEFLSFKSPRLESLIQGRPTLLVHKGSIIARNLEKELLNPGDLRAMLRRQGINDLSEIHDAILESDGSLSVIKSSELQPR